MYMRVLFFVLAWPLLADSAHWAFQPLAQAEAGASIDAFVEGRLAANGLKPAPQADRATLLRRLSYTLTGLPPSQAEIDAFVADPAPDAYAAAVDRLLASPAYGEHWGRHWLDIARYADTRGYVIQDSNLYPYAYTYRDYVIRAFNKDTPYNSFIRQQLAADLIDASEDEQAALGFLTVGRRFLDRRHLIIDDCIDVVTRGLMGLTVACARCHDHKYDPVPIQDYYSLYGIFNSCEEPKELPLVAPPQDTPDYRAFAKELAKRQGAVDAEIAKQTKAHIDEMHKRAAEYVVAATRRVHGQSPGKKDDAFARKPITTLNRRIIGRFADFMKRQPEDQPVLGLWRRLVHTPPEEFAESAKREIAAAEWAHPDVRKALEAKPPQDYESFAAAFGELVARGNSPDADPAFRALLHGPESPTNLQPENAHQVFETKVSNHIRNLRKKVVEWNATGKGAPPRAMIVRDKAQPRDASVFLRGNPGSPGEVVPRQFLAVVAGAKREPFREGSGRRQLSDAIVHPDNPLTARVFVNRVWALHVGSGLVRELDDFGTRGSPPSHPNLLDSLASEFIASGWSMKALHRRILLSRTWQQRSDHENPKAALADPENRLLWRMNRQRLSWEAFRDSVVYAAGQLDRQLGGRPVHLFDAPYSTRRAVYGFVDRQDLPGELRHFDFANPDSATAARPSTTVPQQALFAMNSPFIAHFANALSQRPECAGDNQNFVQGVYRSALGRLPSASELQQALAFLGGATPWRYGYARCLPGATTVSDFRPLPFLGGYYHGGEQMPYPSLGYVLVNGSQMHPGNSAEVCAVRRWVAPAAGSLRIAGKIEHPSDQGDGVRARILSNGELRATATAKQSEASLSAEFAVQAGQIVDFVVDPIAYESYDSCTWAPTLTLYIEGKQIGHWDAAADFAGPDQQARAEFAQVLLMSNEFMFVD
jgi:hypothetical protein